MANVLRSYLRLLEKHPTKMMSCTTGVLMSLGDAISQKLIEKRDGFDFVRNGRFLTFGLFIGGPLFRVWYFSLDKIFGKTKYAAVKMVACDQGLFAPVFLPFFLGTMGLMRMEPIPDVVAKVKQDIKPVLVTNYKIWPAAQLINFLFVPLQHRIFFVNLVSIGWNSYLAWISENKKVDSEKEKDIEMSHKHIADRRNSHQETQTHFAIFPRTMVTASCMSKDSLKSDKDSLDQLMDLY